MIHTNQSASKPLLERLWQHNLRLRSEVNLIQNQDNQYIVANPNSDSYFQCNQLCFEFLKRLDGTQTIQEIVHSTGIDNDQLSQLDALLNKLIEANLINQTDKNSSTDLWWYKFRYPIAMKFKLFDPNKLLCFLQPLASLMFSRIAAIVFFLLLFTCLILLPGQWPALAEHWQNRFFESQNGLLFILAYILLKTLHELGHALAVTKQGGKVKDFGILLLVFMPLPYTNTSASYLFSKRSQRVLVGIAGMWFEMFLAMLAFIYWSTLTPGYLKDFIFNLCFIGSISSIIFNINPLMKFDGYYILCDSLGVLNLNDRAVNTLKRFFKKYLFNIPNNNKASADAAPNHLFLYYCYALLAIPYRIAIGLTIAIYLSDSFFIFGLLLSCWVIVVMLLLPAIKNLKSLYYQAMANNLSTRFFSIVIGFICLTILLININIFSFSSTFPTITTLPSSYIIKTNISGVIEQLHAVNGEYVEKGRLIISLKNPQLTTQLNIAKAKFQEYRAQYHNLQFSDKTMAKSWQERMKLQSNKISELSKKHQELSIRASISGKVSLNNYDDLKTTFLLRGEIIGHITTPARLEITAIVDQANIATIRNNLHNINIMFHTNPGKTYPALLTSIEPAASSKLPSRFLGSSAGGAIIVDASELSGTKSINPFFTLKLQVQNHQLSYLPARGIVKFDSDKTSIIDYLWQTLSYRFAQKINW